MSSGDDLVLWKRSRSTDRESSFGFFGNPRETFVCFLLCVSGMAREKGRREVGEKLHKVLLAISFIIPVLCVQ